MSDNISENSHWVFRAHVIDRAGALTSIASAFSNEGVSIDTVVGHGFEERAGVDGSVILTFYCSELEKDVMVRKVKRLSKVRQLEDVNAREFVILASLAVVVLLFGLWPAPLIDVMHASVGNLLAHVSVSKLPAGETGVALLNAVRP